MKPRITLVSLGVDDLEISLAFYRDGLGLKTKGIVGSEFENGAFVFIELESGLRLALWPRRSLAKDTGLAVGPPKRHRVFSRPQRAFAGGGRRGNGAGEEGRRRHRQTGARDVLGRLCRVFPGPGWAPLGSGMESRHAAG